MFPEIRLCLLWHRDIPLADLVLVLEAHLVVNGLFQLSVAHASDYDEAFLCLAINDHLVKTLRLWDGERHSVAFSHVGVSGEKHVRPKNAPVGDLTIPFQVALCDVFVAFLDMCLQLVAVVGDPYLSLRQAQPILFRTGNGPCSSFPKCHRLWHTPHKRWSLTPGQRWSP